MTEQSEQELGEPKLGPNTGNAGKGRPKGSLNKTTALLKDAILLAAQKAGGGGEEGMVNYLEAQAIANPGPFLGLLGKVLPMTVAGDPNNPVGIEFRVTVLDPAAR
jgi:hypothetical protein